MTRWKSLLPVLTVIISVGTLFSMSPISTSAQTELRRNLISSGSGTVTSGTGGHTIRGSVAQTAVGRTEHGAPGPGGGEDLHLIGFWYRGLRPDVVTTVSLPIMETNTEAQITIPLSLETTGSVGPFVPRGFTARIRFNGTLLHPIGSTPACTYDGSFCTIEITGTATVEDGVIAELQFLTALGDAEKTPLEIVEFRWEKRAEERISVFREDGEVTFLDLCREGDEVRLIRSGSASRLAVHPNPARGGMTTVEFSSNAIGQAELVLIDLLGKEVLRIADQEIKPDLVYRFDVDLQSVPSGSYVVLCRMPASVIARRLVIPD